MHLKIAKKGFLRRSDFSLMDSYHELSLTIRTGQFVFDLLTQLKDLWLIIICKLYQLKTTVKTDCQPYKDGGVFEKF